MVQYGGGLQLQAATPEAGFALQDATPTVISWVVPNDGQLHRVLVLSNLVVSSTLTGGAFGMSGLVSPNGASHNPGIGGGAETAGLYQFTDAYFVEPGSTVTLVQSSAMTGGAAILWAELWGS